MDNQMQCSYSDLISNLPDDVNTRILACLSLKEAARTSLLSKKWRSRWTSIPKLVFDDSFSNLSKSDLFKTINHVLLSHPPPISTFCLRVSGLESCAEVDHLLLFLSKREIQEFTLFMKFKKGMLHRLSSSIFSFQHLRLLTLSCCVFRVPSSFEGFLNLKTIYFVDVDFDGKSFEQILSLCPFIVYLTIHGCSNFKSLVVGAPLLQCFYFSGNTEIISFTMSPLLSSLYIHSTSLIVELNVSSVVGDIVESFACLPVVQTLSLSYQCLLTFVSFGRIPDSLPTKLDSLKILKLVDVSWEDHRAASVMLCLIKSSPNLEELEMKLLCSSDNEDAVPVAANFLEAQNFYSTFSKLRELKLEKFKGVNVELGLVRVILTNAPNLELLDIQPAEMDVNGENRILTVLTNFIRASSRAKIVFHGSSYDSLLDFMI